MGLQNNTKVRTRLYINAIINEAYSSLARKEEVPWSMQGSKTKPTWTVGYDNPETKEGMYVEYFLKEVEEKKPAPEREYQAGDWRDPELNK